MFFSNFTFFTATLFYSWLSSCKQKHCTQCTPGHFHPKISHSTKQRVSPFSEGELFRGSALPIQYTDSGSARGLQNPHPVWVPNTPARISKNERSTTISNRNPSCQWFCNINQYFNNKILWRSNTTLWLYHLIFQSNHTLLFYFPEITSAFQSLSALHVFSRNNLLQMEFVKLVTCTA